MSWEDILKIDTSKMTPIRDGVSIEEAKEMVQNLANEKGKTHYLIRMVGGRLLYFTDESLAEQTGYGRKLDRGNNVLRFKSRKTLRKAEEEDDDFPRYVPRDGAYVTVEELEERGRYIFDKKNVGRVYRNKNNNKNYIFNRLYNNGEIELISQPDKKEYKTMREQLQASIDKLKEAQGKEGENPNLDAAIKNTQLLLENEDDEVLDYRRTDEEKVHRITPVFASTYELLPEQ